MADFAALAELSELGGTLELVLLVGPDLRGEEGLRIAREHLPKERPTRWVYLDEEEPDLGRVLGENRGAVVLAHGLEYMLEKKRHEVEESLNLLRDTLAGREGIIVLWVPRSELEGFRVWCADLFQWRSLLLVLDSVDVPLDWAEEARRRYLVGLLEREAEAEPWLVEPDVEFEGQRMALRHWVETLLASPPRLVLLLDYPAQEESRVLLWLAAQRAHQALRQRGPTPVAGSLPIPEVIGAKEVIHFVDQAGWIDQEALGVPGFARIQIAMPRVRLMLVAVHPCSNLASQWRAWVKAKSIPYREFTLCPYSQKQLRSTSDNGERLLSEQEILELTGWLGELCIPPLFFAYFSAASTERMKTFDVLAEHFIPDEIVLASVHDPSWPSHLGMIVDRQMLIQILAGGETEHVDLDILYGQAIDDLVFIGMLGELDGDRYEIHSHFLWGYFAARHLLESDGDALEAVRPHLDDPRWRQVIIMVAARLSRLSTHRQALWKERLWPLLWPAVPSPGRMALAIETAVDAGLSTEELAPRLRQAQAALDAGGGTAEERSALSDALRRARV